MSKKIVSKVTPSNGQQSKTTVNPSISYKDSLLSYSSSEKLDRPLYYSANDELSLSYSMSKNHHNSFRSLICNIRDAVVHISGHFLTHPRCATPEVSQHSNECSTNEITDGNGFFISGHYIVCPAALIMNRLKNESAIIFADKILVDVSNVEGKSKSYSFQANLIGYDGVGNIAILSLNKPINKAHPVLHWGKSRNACPGDKIIVIGDVVGVSRVVNITPRYNPVLNMNLEPMLDFYKTNISSENGVIIGNIIDNRYVCPLGCIAGELLLISDISNVGKHLGLPVLSYDGKVIGMVVSTDHGTVAVSEFFMRRPIKCILHNDEEKYRGSIETIPDTTIKRLIKSRLGLGGVLVTQNDFYYMIELLDDGNIVQKRMDHDNTTDPFEILGYRIIAIDPRSPLINKINIGDIVTHIGKKALGDRKGQESPALTMWKTAPGDIVELTYLNQEDNFKRHKISIPTSSYEFNDDYPRTKMNYGEAVLM
jgi:hypothetical protein